MSVSLILNNRPVPRAQLADLPGLPPNFAVVYPMDGGGWEVESQRHRTMTQRWLTKNKLCYVVDLGDHRRTAKLTRTPLTCKDQAHRFEATIDVGFRVHDPVAVVRSNLPDVLSAVYPYLISKIRPHAAQFAIDEAFEAQARINGSLVLPMPLSEGMTLYYCDVQLEPDEAAREFIRSRTKAGRASEMGRLQHHAVLGNTRHQEAVKDIEQEARIARDRRERAALSSVQLDFRGLILEHLAKHPDDTEKSMELLLRWDEGRQLRALDQEQRQVEMVRYMIDKGIVREVDVPGLREGVLGPSTVAFGGMLPPGSGEPAQPAPASAHTHPPAAQPSPAAGRPPTPPPPPAPPWGGTRPDSAQAPGGSPSAAPSDSRAVVGLAPVYVVLDTSSAAAGCVTELRDALRSLQTVLANSPDVTTAVRLSVLTFSGTSDVRLPLTQISWQTGIPDLLTGDGCRYEPVFRRLLELVPLETERLKQQARVNRPTVFFLAVGDPEDGGEWQAAHQELMRHRYRPNIVACGIGATDRRTVARIASPSEFAVAADARAGLAESVAQFSMLLQNTVLHLGRSAVAGSSELRLERPQGLTPIEDVE
ncbi:vWA domain-containing protein [Streptomyces pratensis]|uniref:vWA domain-containing protein n=1 Tax=Streptomyces pratensis TaxID=1169025 RepID=UPI00363D1214